VRYMWDRGGLGIIELVDWCIIDLIIEAQNVTSGVTSGDLQVAMLCNFHLFYSWPV